ncbi:PQQ-binding-like beta-propeller repeat protein, partial [Enterococcus casseliflavus]|uniref:outer membrane protein assembly factor BamB family protein n=1 Tax=Enterococcus casseliflavus TaxID=37734 RepID=UPI003D1206DE
MAVPFDQPVSNVESQGSYPPSPAADAGVAVVAGSDCILRAIEILDGRPRWEFDVGGQGLGSPWAVDGRVYVGRLNQNLYVLNAAD